MYVTASEESPPREFTPRDRVGCEHRESSPLKPPKLSAASHTAFFSPNAGLLTHFCF